MIDPAAINPLDLPSVTLEERSQLPTVPCIYFAIDSEGVVQYIGKSINLKQRWIGHQRYPSLVKMNGVKISYMPVDISLLLQIEKALIAWFVPPLNFCKASALNPESKGLKIIIEVGIEGLGLALKKAREAAGISLTVAGDRSGMSGGNFNRIENEDTKGVPLSTLIRAAEAVNLNLAECPKSFVDYAYNNKKTQSSFFKDVERVEKLKAEGKSRDEIIETVWRVSPTSHVIEWNDDERCNYQYDILVAFVNRVKLKRDDVGRSV